MNPPELPPSYDPAYEETQRARVAAGPRAEGPGVGRSAARIPADVPSADFEVDLLRRIAGGDEVALGALYDRRSGVVHALVLQLVGDADDAEDVVEEVFWQAWRQAGRYEASRGSVATWLVTIARSRALDRLRAMRRRREDRLPESDGEGVGQLDVLLGAYGDTAHQAEHADVATMVASALSELPREQQEALDLAYFGGLSQSEIALRIGQPLGTVKTRTRLGLQKLREKLSMLRGEDR